jgi:ribosomal-protein-alanine N-acetyltransferase
VAWIRLAAVDGDLDIERWLDLSLPPTVRALSARGVRELAWMDSWVSGPEPYEDWARTHLKPRGFSPLAEIVTLTKTNQQLPDTPTASKAEPGIPEITLRPAANADLPAIVAIDRAAFAPYWWRSEATLGRRATTACRFAVAECGSEVIGYTECELHLPTAHLNRIAIHPRSQGRGVGAILLSHVLQALWQRGARTVSLNTQRHNHRSRRLYERFGFRATGDVVTAWTLRLIVPHLLSPGTLDSPH